MSCPILQGRFCGPWRQRGLTDKWIVRLRISNTSLQVHDLESTNSVRGIPTLSDSEPLGLSDSQSLRLLRSRTLPHSVSQTFPLSHLKTLSLQDCQTLRLCPLFGSSLWANTACWVCFMPNIHRAILIALIFSINCNCINLTRLAEHSLIMCLFVYTYSY